MLARAVLRAGSRPVFTAVRCASSISASSIDAMNPHGIEISKAQRIAEDGLVSGTICPKDDVPDESVD